MLKITAMAVILLVILGSCRKKACEPDTYYYNFKNNAKVDTSTSGGQAPLRAFAVQGNKRVFVYLHAHSPCEDVVDGFVSTQIIFEVDPSVNKFTLQDDDLSDIHCYFAYFLDGSSNTGAYTPTGGLIEGVKINESAWNVHFDLKLKNNQTVTGAGKFIIQ